MQIKHVQVDALCPICNEGVETIFHALVQCKLTTMCWKIFDPGINTDGDMDFLDWIQGILAGQYGDSETI